VSIVDDGFFARSIASDLERETESLRRQLGEAGEAQQKAVAAERARVLRAFDAALAGAVVDDEFQARLAYFAELVRSGKDVRS
jgi:hypothetical protein